MFGMFVIHSPTHTCYEGGNCPEMPINIFVLACKHFLVAVKLNTLTWESMRVDSSASSGC